MRTPRDRIKTNTHKQSSQKHTNKWYNIPHNMQTTEQQRTCSTKDTNHWKSQTMTRLHTCNMPSLYLCNYFHIARPNNFHDIRSIRSNFIIIWTAKIRHNTLSNRNHNRNIINTFINVKCTHTETRCLAMQIPTRYKSHIRGKKIWYWEGDFIITSTIYDKKCISHSNISHVECTKYRNTW